MVDHAGSGMTGFHQLIMVAAAEISILKKEISTIQVVFGLENYQQQLLQPIDEQAKNIQLIT